MGLEKTFEAILDAFALALVACAALLPFFGAPRLVPRVLFGGALICLAATVLLAPTGDITGLESEFNQNEAARFGIRVVTYLVVLTSLTCSLIYPLILRSKRYHRRKLYQWGLGDTLQSMTALALLLGLGIWLFRDFSQLDDPRIWQMERKAWGFHGLGPLQIAVTYYFLAFAVVVAAKARSSSAMAVVAILAPVFAITMTYLPVLLGVSYRPDLFALERLDLSVTLVQPLAFVSVLNLCYTLNQSALLRPKHFLRERTRRDHSHMKFLAARYFRDRHDSHEHQPSKA
ncbi:MAG: hypothetical protein MPJ50_07455 [Pirellulales bacterium]|nr:hypothetical protein [Pirellulales bacterium]